MDVHMPSTHPHRSRAARSRKKARVPCLIIAAVICGAVSMTARAEVTESSATSFTVKHVETIAAKPPKVWQSILTIDKWWSSDHTFSGSASNLRLDSRAGGCFCETLPNGGSVQHMTVVFVAPNTRITMTGGLGPLQTTAASGALSLQMVPEGEGSSLTLIYSVSGAFPGGLNTIAPGVNTVLEEQYARLKRLIETGSAEEKAATKPGETQSNSP